MLIMDSNMQKEIDTASNREKNDSNNKRINRCKIINNNSNRVYFKGEYLNN